MYTLSLSPIVHTDQHVLRAIVLYLEEGENKEKDEKLEKVISGVMLLGWNLRPSTILFNSHSPVIY